MKNKKENFLSRNLKKSINDLKKYKNYFWTIFLIFFASGIIGLAFPIFFKEQIIKLITELIEKTKGLSTFELIRFIILNNTQSAFLGLILGIFVGIFPILMILLNGYVLGFVVNKSVIAEGVLILWRLFPHGVFEIPAIIISAGLGLMIGFSLMKNCLTNYDKKMKKETMFFLILLSVIFFPISFLIYFIFTFSDKKLKKSFLKNITNSLRIFIFIVIPLLLIAGIIEGLLIGIIN